MTSENVTPVPMPSQVAPGLNEIAPAVMWRSAEISQLAAALATAQGAIRNAAKDSANPFFRSKYADLSAVWDACREALSTNGLSVTQHPTMEFRGEPEIVKIPTRGGEGERVVVRCLMTVKLATRLLHSSGEWMESTLTSILPGADPQTVGSALTYLRRYGLAAMVGVAPADDDDDGEGAAANGNDRQVHHQPSRPPVQQAQRVSEKPVEPATVATDTYVGIIAEITDLSAPPGAIGVAFKSGENTVKMVAREAGIVAAMREHKKGNTVIEVVTKRPKPGFAALVTEIDVVPPPAPGK